jgi:hypothetical protein
LSESRAASACCGFARSNAGPKSVDIADFLLLESRFVFSTNLFRAFAILIGEYPKGETRGVQDLRFHTAFELRI